MYDFSVTAGRAYFFNPDESLKSIVVSSAQRSALWAMQLLKEQPEGFTDIQNLSLALNNGINHKIYSVEEINQLLEILSPFENKERTPWVEKIMRFIKPWFEADTPTVSDLMDFTRIWLIYMPLPENQHWSYNVWTVYCDTRIIFTKMITQLMQKMQLI